MANDKPHKLSPAETRALHYLAGPQLLGPVMATLEGERFRSSHIMHWRTYFSLYRKGLIYRGVDFSRISEEGQAVIQGSDGNADE